MAYIINKCYLNLKKLMKRCISEMLSHESSISFPRGGHQVNSLISMPAGGTECSIHTCQQINVFCLWQCLMAFSRVKAEKKRNDLFLLNKIETLRRQFHFRRTLSFSDYRSTAQPINSLSAHSGKMGDTGYLAGLWAVVGDG